ncbi:MAG: glycosyltransferase family 39 protein [Desulfobacterales bacterium]|nr:glycosyltransferase family 39 protein [Desulfobacterales bacterium]
MFFLAFYHILKSQRARILWSIFILASLLMLILESSSAQTNLIMGFLLLSSFYLFVFGVKENERKSVIFSAVAFCIALGTKNTAIFFIPAFALGYLLIAIKEKKHQFYKPLLLFTGAFIIGFIFLASYNYVSNYLSFGNPIAADIFLDRHSNNISFKAFIANLIRYLTFFIDFTGIKIANELAPHILSARDFLFILFDISPKDGLAVHDNYSINFKIHENLSMFGILGFLLIIPLALKCCFRKISFKNNKSFYISVSALIALGFLLTISALMGFIFWSNRYLTTAVIVCSLILAYSYNKKLNLTKLIITIIAIFNYSVVSTMCVAKPFIEVSKELGNYGYFNFRNEARFRNEANFKEKPFIT